MRLLTAPADLFPLPLTAFERFMVTDDSPAYPMTLLVDCVLDGELQRGAFERAVARAVARNPLLGARIGQREGRWCWLAPEGRPRLDWLASDHRGRPAWDWIDLAREPGLRIAARQEGGACRIFFQVHHACCDGRGIRRFLSDLLNSYDAELPSAGEPPRLDPHDFARLRERGRFGGGGASTIPLRNKIRNAIDFYFRKATLLGAPAGPPRGDAPALLVVQEEFTPEEAEPIRVRARTSGVSLNDLAIGTLFQVVAHWNRRHATGSDRRPIRILVPTDFRGHEDRQLPAANRVGFAFLTRHVAACDDWDALLPGIAAEMDHIRQHRIGLDFVHGVALAQRIPGLLTPLMRHSGCLATAVLTNLGDPGRRFRRGDPPREEPVAGRVRLRQVFGTPPIRRWTRAGFGLCWYDGRMQFSLRCDPHLFNADSARLLLDLYIEAWRGWGRGEPSAARD